MDATATLERTTPEVHGEREASVLLARGRFEEARGAVRRARRRVGGDRSPALLALLECDALDGLGRDADALAIATRALTQGVGDRDLAARLRVARALALWQTGRPAPAKAEAQRALEGAETALTRARALEALAAMAFSEDDLDRSREFVVQALALSEAAGYAAGVARACRIGAVIERAAWRFEAALAYEDRRLAVAERLGPHVAFAAAVGRAEVLTSMGQWTAAEGERQRLEARFPDRANAPLACILRANLARSRGDLGTAQRALAALRAACGPGARLRLRAECHLLASDVTLASGDPEDSDREALQALRLGDLLGERGIRSRGRARRVHALLTAGRPDEAIVEARRAAADASTARPELQAHAGLALARAVWRRNPGEAERACRTVAQLSAANPGFQAVAQFGEAVAGGAAPEVIAERLAAIERWGDRRVLAYSLTELRHVRVQADAVRVADTLPSVPPSPNVGVDPITRALLDAAHAMADEGDWADRWTAATRALSPVLPWRRACVGVFGLELRHDEDHPRSLAANDLSRLVIATAGGRSVIDLAGDPELRLHPTRALLGLAASVVAPAGESWVCCDVGERHAVSDRDIALVRELGRLLARFAPDALAAAPEPVALAKLPGLLGDSGVMRLLFETIERAARFEVTVHVCGETGTGKERVAQAVHQRSARASRPFVAVNASSLSDDLFESEMFGHLRGSFTGAVADREGHVAAAEGGTLFLDEITDLSPRAQAKLLRLLEVKEYRRVGESRMRTADVRFVTASNVPLDRRVAEGRFRADLMYRLNRMVLGVPPLRERGDDVALLARHFLRRAATRAGVPVPALAADAERALRAYAWPGNVRELENEMDRMVVMGRSGRIRRDDLSLALREPVVAAADSLREAVRGFEREHIASVLRRHGGNRSRAACLLGLTRQALVAKISRLGIEVAAGAR